MNLVELDKALRKLRLSGMANVLETRLLQAQTEQLAPIDLLAALVSDELQRREDRLLERRHKQARFRDPDRSLDGFDFDFNKKINRALVFELATARFIAKREDVLLIGQPGTGKSHLAQAIGRAAIQQGHRVLYRETHTFLEELAEATLAETRKEYLAELARAHLLIIDDLGMRKLPHTAAEDLLELIMRRYERASTMLTSNRPVDEWGKLLGDTAAVTALLDRLLASRPRAQVRAAKLAHPGADHLSRVDGRRVTMGSRSDVTPASEGVRSLPPVAPALHSRAEDSRAAERQRPSGRGPRARERRRQARLAQLPTPTGHTAAACARRAFRGTRVVARRNALSASSSITPSGPARPFRLARVSRPGMTNADVRPRTHPRDRTRQGHPCARSTTSRTLSRTNAHAYTDADDNRAVGLSPRLRLDRSADRFPLAPLRNGVAWVVWGMAPQWQTSWPLPATACFAEPRTRTSRRRSGAFAPSATTKSTGSIRPSLTNVSFVATSAGTTMARRIFPPGSSV